MKWLALLKMTIGLAIAIKKEIRNYSSMPHLRLKRTMKTDQVDSDCVNIYCHLW